VSKKKEILKSLGWAGNARAAASKTKLTLEQVKAAKDAGCPAFHPSGRIECDKLIEWVAANPEIVGLDGKVDKRLEEALRIRVDRMTRELRFGVLKGRLIDKAIVRQGITAGVSTLFTELDRVRGEAPGALKGNSEREIDIWFERQINHIRSNLTAKFAAIGEGESDE
jgi:hypothetical protein